MKRILLIEPDRQLAKLMKRALANSYKVEVAHDSQTAISIADERTPDVIVLELAIPKHNGVAFLQEFRSYSDWAKVPVIIYTQIPGEDTGLSAHAWQKLGVSTYLYKPKTRLANLINNIEQLLPNHEVERTI